MTLAFGAGIVSVAGSVSQMIIDRRSCLPMDTWDAIRARRNVRSYRPGPVAEGDLDRIAEAGWRAPASSTTTTSGKPRTP
jgi:hypothetical protein